MGLDSQIQPYLDSTAGQHHQCHRPTSPGDNRTDGHRDNCRRRGDKPIPGADPDDIRDQ